MSPDAWFALLSFAAWFYLMVTSAWLRGSQWFAATLVTLGLFLSSFLIGLPADDLVPGLAGISIMFLFFFYLIAGKYITKTKSLDLTYQSAEALNKYIAENNLAGPLITAVRALPPILMVAIVVVGIIGFLSK